MADDITDRRRHELEHDLIMAALALTGHTRSAAVLLPIPGTKPPIFVCVGDAAWLARSGKMKGGRRVKRARARIVSTVTASDHGFSVGDTLDISAWTGRWRKLKPLLTKPRISYIANISPSTFDLAERRMTWREWRNAVWMAIR